MKALVFRGKNQIGLEEVPIPRPGFGEVVIRVMLTTICGTDIHIVRGEYPVRPGLILGHEPVGTESRWYQAALRQKSAFRFEAALIPLWMRWKG